MSERHVCATCGDTIEYLNPSPDPEGGWWSHWPPADHDHEAQPESDSDSELEMPSIRTWVDPPEGWHHFGTHVTGNAAMEFSVAQDDDGLPLYERPIQED